tara:strand:- start:714 stop:1166 length:453 start_codon:yes stop_codon:yes gene_type:complete
MSEGNILDEILQDNNNQLDPIHDLAKALAALIGEHLPAHTTEVTFSDVIGSIDNVSAFFNSDNVSEILRDEIRDVVRDEANGGSISDSLYDNISDCISECEIDSHQVYYGEGFYQEVHDNISHLIGDQISELLDDAISEIVSKLEIVVGE